MVFTAQRKRCASKWLHRNVVMQKWRHFDDGIGSSSYTSWLYDISHKNTKWKWWCQCYFIIIVSFKNLCHFFNDVIVTLSLQLSKYFRVQYQKTNYVQNQSCLWCYFQPKMYLFNDVNNKWLNLSKIWVIVYPHRPTKFELSNRNWPQSIYLLNISRYANLHQYFGVLDTAQFAPNSSWFSKNIWILM